MANQEVFIWAHRANIERYERMMKTPLTAVERGFIAQRIAEETAELNRLLLVGTSVAPVPGARPVMPPSSRDLAPSSPADARALAYGFAGERAGGRR